MNSGQARPAEVADAVGQRPRVMVAAEGICRTFGGGHTAVHALRGVSFTIDRGQLVALRGRSGSGKTTLLNIIGGLDNPSAGRVWVDGREVNRMSERERLALRRDRLAFIFQSFGLVPMLSAAENVGIPLRIAGLRPSERRERVGEMLALTGVSSHAAHTPDELSGGQQQRVAIARALAGRPGLLIADEPTSQLDLETGRQIMELLLSVVRSEGITALVATHDEALIDLADQVIVLEDGSVTAVDGRAVDGG
jgi:putative ABC transport system ATP-binding protein